MEILLLAFEKFRWYVRYPAAALMLWISWYLFTVNHFYSTSIIFLLCAAVVIKEAAPSLLLFAGSIWLWPDDFLSITFAQMTFGIILAALVSVLMFVAAPLAALVLYSKREYAKYVSELK